MIRRVLFASVMLAWIAAFSPVMTPAQACPSCKTANATDNRLPLAYQASILFMLTVPALMVTGFGVGLYKLNKVQEQALAEFENGDVWTGDPGIPEANDPDGETRSV